MEGIYKYEGTLRDNQFSISKKLTIISAQL